MFLLAVTERSFYGLQNWWLSVWSNANASTAVRMRGFLVGLHGFGKRLVFWQLQLKARPAVPQVCLSAVCAEPLESYTCVTYLGHTTNLIKYVPSRHQVLVCQRHQYHSFRW